MCRHDPAHATLFPALDQAVNMSRSHITNIKVFARCCLITNYILVYSVLEHDAGILTKHDFQVIQGSVETLIR